MTKRIFRSIWLVALAVFLASLALIMGLMYTYFSEVQRNQLRTQTQLVAQGATHEGLKYFSGLEIADCRITWIDTDGTVLYDNRSESTQMENHLEREEIREALETGHGESERYSATLLQRSLYCTQRLDDGTVLRLSTSQSSVLNLLLGVAQPICLVIAIALLLSAVLAHSLSRRIVDPLNRLDLDHPLTDNCYEEIKPLLRRIDAQQRELRCHATALARKENEFIAVTDSMSEGLVLLGSNCTILTMNSAARRLLNLSHRSIGTDILSYDKNLADLLIQALEGKRAEKIIPLSGCDYQVDANPVITDEAVTGVVLLLFDVTEKLRSEQMRREFTANVSHELKTPLQSISGYAELISRGIARPEDMGRFSEQIHTEAQRMIRLVEDIIRLSQLDEGSVQTSYEVVDLYSLAQQVLDALSGEASRAQVTLHLEGNAASLRSIPAMLTAVLTNLCDNAIKYNRAGGTVTVCVGQSDGCVWFSVADTGIGIPPEHHGRIFERFYRVDKSHSKAVGGTGLGLSIVKHTVLSLGGKIALQSSPGVGSTFTVRFPQ